MRIFNTISARMIALVMFIALFSFSVSGVLIYKDVKEQMIERYLQELKIAATLTGKLIDASQNTNNLPTLMKDISKESRMRVTLIEKNGSVIADSAIDDLSYVDNHADRPEVKAALEGAGDGYDIRSSSTTKEQYLYYAQVRGEIIIRLAMPIADMAILFESIKNKILAATAIALLLSLLAALWGIKKITAPISSLANLARSLQGGGAQSGEANEANLISHSIKQMSEKLNFTSAALEQERGLMHNLVEYLPVQVLLIDKAYKILYANDAMEWLLRSKPIEIAGESLQAAVKETRLAELAKKAAADGRLAMSSFEIIRGNKFFITATATPVGEYILLVLQDLTKHYELENMKRDFIADASHELQTPLTVIRAATDLLFETHDEEEKITYLSMIAEQQKRMTALVDDMLLLSRLESEVAAEEEKELNLTQLTAELAEEAKFHPKAEQIEIEYIALKDKSDIYMKGRAEEITRAIRNLIDNAIKYTHKKYWLKRGGKIRITAKEDAHSCMVEVADNGIGVGEDEKRVIFERFKQAERSEAVREKTGGYGLGLAIASRIAKGHGGEIKLSRKDGMTIFEFSAAKNKK